MLDVLIVSLGSTGGLRVADRELLESLRRAGASAELTSPELARAVRTMMLTDLLWARGARRAARSHLNIQPARSVIYSSTTAALFWPSPGAIRFDAPAAGNRPGRHGLWQRPLELARLGQAPLLLPWSEGAVQEIPASMRRPGETLVLPVAIEPSAAPGKRDIAAITYAANPSKKGLDRVLEAWRRARRTGEELILVGARSEQLRRAGYGVPAEGVRVTGPLSFEEYRGLLARARVFVCAPRREDYGIAQLEALVDGCRLVSTPAPGPYAALALARRLDPRLVTDDLASALRTALDEPAEGYAERALAMLEPFRRASCDRLVADVLLARLLS